MTSIVRRVLVTALVLGLTACATATPGPTHPEQAGVDTSSPLGPQAKAAILADDLPTLEALLAAGLDLGSDLGRGYTPLHLAATADQAAVVASLLAAGADVNAVADKGETPLMMASAHGGVATVDELLAAGADVALADDLNLSSALHYAISTGNDAVMLVLIAAGADVNQLNAAGEDAIMFASHEDKVGAAKIALSAGSDFTLRRTDTGATALSMAEGHGRTEIAELLRAAGATV